MVCDAVDAAEEVDANEEAAAELAEEAAARWAPSKEPVTPSKVPVATFLIAEAKTWQAEPPHVCPCTSPMCHILQRPPHGQSPQPASDATTLRWLSSIMPANHLEPQWLLVSIRELLESY